MRPTVSSDESINVDRSVARYTDHSSRRPKEQISASKNAQTEYETHLSQNAAYSSTYGPDTTPLDRHTAYRERRVNVKEDQRDVTRNPEITEQKHKSIDTRDIDSSRGHRSKSCCVTLRLWCLRLCRTKKRCFECVSRKSRRLLERIRARSRECGKPDDAVAVAGVSTVPHRESINHREDARKKSRRGRKQDEEAAAEIADKDVSQDVGEEEKERRKRERQERRRKVTTVEEEGRQRRERRKRKERVPHLAEEDARPVARDDDLVVEDRAIPAEPPSIADFAKSCCYLCARNALTIAAATAVPKPELSDKAVQVSDHKFHAETFPTLDRSCSPMLLVRTVRSFVKVRTREIGTLCPGASALPRGDAVPRAKKRKRFTVFSGLTRTKCPAGRHAACGTDKSTARRDDDAEKREPRNERCCREKNVRQAANFAETYPD